MGDVRYNPITGEPVILSTARAERPGAWYDAPTEGAPGCPFCPGNESETPPEITRAGGDRWQARVVPNKYPAISAGSQPRHEVMIDSPRHDQQFEEMTVDQLAASLSLWKERFAAQERIDGTAYVAIFRNEGRSAGQSIPHPHSQILGLEFVPPRIERELEGFRRRECPMCALAADASTSDALVIRRTDNLILFTPYASRAPFEMWVAPKSHESDWRSAIDRELASLLLLAVRKLRTVHPGAAFNLGVVTAPLRTENAERFHWYLEIVPRLTNVAGFEISTGGWINIESPERAAARLRECSVRTD